jgi:polyphosphate glucokinase
MIGTASWQKIFDPHWERLVRTGQNTKQAGLAIGDRASDDPRTLAVDVGGTGLKASVLDSTGKMVVKRVRVATPYPCKPKILLPAIADLAALLPPFDRISIGFPGVIREGRVITAPHFDADAWRDYPLEEAISRRLGKPARMLNDAEVQGLGIFSGRGIEVVLTLGTGVGTAVFSNGTLSPHLELAQHPIHRSKTYNDYIGNEARRTHGTKKWNRRVLNTIELVYSLLHYDILYLGGGNSAHLAVDLPKNVRVISNDTGMTGGIRLWDEDIWETVRQSRAQFQGASAIGRSHRVLAKSSTRSLASGAVAGAACTAIGAVTTPGPQATSSRHPRPDSPKKARNRVST